jgi:hypothetical protein
LKEQSARIEKLHVRSVQAKLAKGLHKIGVATAYETRGAKGFLRDGHTHVAGMEKLAKGEEPSS